MPATLRAILDSRQYVKGGADIDKTNARIGKSTRTADRRMKGFGRSTQRAGMHAQKAAGSIRGLLAGITGFLVIRAAVKTIADFGDTMAMVGEVAGASEKELAKLTSTARELGATTRFTAKEAAEGLLFLSRAGFEVNESLLAIPHTLNLAIAGAIELGEAADFASNVLAQFRLSAEETERVVDTLVMTSNSANTNVRQLAEALKMVGPVAGAVGISVEETAAAIGVLGNSGIQATMAGTQLRGTFAALLGPTSKAKRALAEMGISIEDVNPQKHNLIEIFRQFAQANINASQAVQIFGRRQAAAVLTLSAGVEELERLNDKNLEAEETAKRMAQTMQNTLGGSFKALRSAIDELFLATGDKGLAGGLKRVVDISTQAVRILADMSPEVDENTRAAKTLAVILKTLAKVIGIIIAYKVIDFFVSFTAAIINTTIALVKLLPAIAAVAIALTAFEFGRWLYDEFKVVREIMVELTGFLKFSWEKIKYGFIIAAKAIGFAWDKVMLGLVNAVTWFLKKVRNALASIEEVAVHLGISFGDSIGNITGAANALDMAADKYRKSWTEATEDVRGTHEAMITNILNETENARETVDAMFGGIGGKRRKGQTFGEFLLKDFEKVKAKMAELLDMKHLLEEPTTQGEGKQAPVEFAGPTFAGFEDMAILEERLRDVTDEQIEAMRRQRAESLALKIAEAERLGFIEDVLTQLEDERQLLQMTNQEREVELQLRALLEAAQKEGIELTDEEVGKLREALVAHEKYKDSFMQLTDAARAVGDAFGRAFEDIIFGTKSAKEAVSNMIRELSKEIFNQLVTKQISAAITNSIIGIGGAVMGADGLVINRGEVVPFQQGGIVNTPVAFPMANNRTGIMGEAGPEAILPLFRGHGGKLGVRMEGEGAPKTQVVNFNISTPDVQGFRRSRAQITNDMLRVMKQQRES